MHSLKYLNGVLTVLAVLLTLNLWVTWTDSSADGRLPLVSEAHAQTGVPNASQQRLEMINLLKQTNVHLGEVKQLLTSGQMRVQAEAPQADNARE